MSSTNEIFKILQLLVKDRHRIHRYPHPLTYFDHSYDSHPTNTVNSVQRLLPAMVYQSVWKRKIINKIQYKLLLQLQPIFKKENREVFKKFLSPPNNVKCVK